MAARLFVAQKLYEANCAAFGGVDADGLPLPTFQSLLNDPSKRASVQMWIDAADRSTARPIQTVRPVVTGGWG